MSSKDHRDIIAALSSAEKSALLEKSDRPGLIYLSTHWGIITASALGIHHEVIFWPALVFIEGLFLTFLFTAMHEAIHETAFKSNWLNRLTAWSSGLVVLLTPRWFGYFHFDHHKYNF